MMIMLVPLLTILVPLVKVMPPTYRWQVRRKIYTGSSEAWRRYESHLEPLLAKLKATT